MTAARSLFCSSLLGAAFLLPSSLGAGSQDAHSDNNEFFSEIHWDSWDQIGQAEEGRDAAYLSLPSSMSSAAAPQDNTQCAGTATSVCTLQAEVPVSLSQPSDSGLAPQRGTETSLTNVESTRRVFDSTFANYAGLMELDPSIWVPETWDVFRLARLIACAGPEGALDALKRAASPASGAMTPPAGWEKSISPSAASEVYKDLAAALRNMAGSPNIESHVAFRLGVAIRGTPLGVLASMEALQAVGSPSLFALPQPATHQTAELIVPPSGCIQALAAVERLIHGEARSSTSRWRTSESVPYTELALHMTRALAALYPQPVPGRGSSTADDASKWSLALVVKRHTGVDHPQTDVLALLAGATVALQKTLIAYTLLEQVLQTAEAFLGLSIGQTLGDFGRQFSRATRVISYIVGTEEHRGLDPAASLEVVIRSWLKDLYPTPLQPELLSSYTGVFALVELIAKALKAMILCDFKVSFEQLLSLSYLRDLDLVGLARALRLDPKATNPYSSATVLHAAVVKAAAHAQGLGLREEYLQASDPGCPRIRSLVQSLTVLDFLLVYGFDTKRSTCSPGQEMLDAFAEHLEAISRQKQGY